MFSQLTRVDNIFPFSRFYPSTWLGLLHDDVVILREYERLPQLRT